MSNRPQDCFGIGSECLPLGTPLLSDWQSLSCPCTLRGVNHTSPDSSAKSAMGGLEAT